MAKTSDKKEQKVQKKKTTYDHVGRPTNEEVRNRKNKKVLITVGIVLFIGIGLLLIFGRNTIVFDTIMGNSSVGKKQSARVMTYIDSSKKTSKVVYCPVGQSLYKNGNNFKCVYNFDKRRRSDPTILTIPYYSQNDYDRDYSACGGGTLPYKGCLPTNGAMIFSALLNKQITPPTINNKAKEYINAKNSGDRKITYQICSGNYYYVDFLKQYAKDNNIRVKTYYFGGKKSRKQVVETVLKNLQTARCLGIAALSTSSSCYGEAKQFCYDYNKHFVMFYSTGKYGNLKDKDTMTKVYVNDPARKNVNGSWVEYRQRKVNLENLIDSTQAKTVNLFCRDK